jgi:hypothetical protein
MPGFHTTAATGVYETLPPKCGKAVAQTLDYLIGEKFINYLEAAEGESEWTAEIQAFVAEIKTIFEPFQLAQYLETVRQTEPFDPLGYDDPEEAEMERQSELRRSAAELLLVERAREWLLEED